MNNHLELSFIKPKDDKSYLSSTHRLQSHRQRPLDTSSTSNVSEIIHLLNERNPKPKNVPLGDFITTIKDTMAKYQTDGSSSRLITKTDEDDIKYKISKDETKKIDLILHQNKNQIFKRSTEDSFLKITITENDDYSSPYESLSVIKRNKSIHDLVNKNYLQRQKYLTGEAINKIERGGMKYNLKMPTIRISPMIQRSMLDILRENETEESDDLDDDREQLSQNQIRRNNRKKTTLRFISNKNAISNSLRLFAYYRYANKNFPEGREQFSLSTNLVDIVLVGGIGSNVKNNDVWILSSDTFVWTRLHSKNIAPNPRYGHTTVLHQKKLYVFGGRTKYSNLTLFADFEVFNILDQTWTNPTVGSKHLIKLRRNHIAQLIGSQMLVHGGISETGETLNDTYLLNISPLKWIACSISSDCSPPALFGHSCSLILQSEIQYNQKLSIYRYPEGGRTSLNKIKEKGLYVFGGKTKEDGGVIKNDLWVLSIGKRPAEWSRLECQGHPPPPRYYHTMNFHEAGNLLIVHGGRNDNTSYSFALNDTYILNLGNLDWNEIKLYSWTDEFRVLNRCGHSSTICSNKLIIFGGLNSNNYIGSTFFVINLDFSYQHVKSSPEDEKEIEETLKISGHMNPATKHLLDQMIKPTKRNQISVVPEIILPEIK